MKKMQRLVLLFMLAGCYVEVRPHAYRHPSPCPGGIWVEGHYGMWHRWHPGHWRCGEREIIIEER